MKQHTNCILANVLSHLIEHCITVHLVLYQRIALSVCLKSCALTELVHIIDVIHPLAVDNLEQNYALDLTDLLRIRKLGFL